MFLRQETAVLQQFLMQFPKEINRENFLRIREISCDQ
jgi:hypothetical protein